MAEIYPEEEPPSFLYDDNDDDDLLNPIPKSISEIYALRKALVAAKDLPRSCADAIEVAGGELIDARSEFQSKFHSPQVLRDFARRRFHAAHIAMTTEMLMAEVSLMERQAKFDRLVYLLRGDYFFTNLDFDVDSGYNGIDVSYLTDGWRSFAHPAIYEMLSP